jgi:hypothetical protein
MSSARRPRAQTTPGFARAGRVSRRDGQRGKGGGPRREAEGKGKEAGGEKGSWESCRAADGGWPMTPGRCAARTQGHGPRLVLAESRDTGSEPPGPDCLAPRRTGLARRRPGHPGRNRPNIHAGRGRPAGPVVGNPVQVSAARPQPRSRGGRRRRRGCTTAAPALQQQLPHPPFPPSPTLPFPTSWPRSSLRSRRLSARPCARQERQPRSQSEPWAGRIWAKRSAARRKRPRFGELASRRQGPRATGRATAAIRRRCEWRARAHG